MQNVTADTKLSADMKAMSVSRKSQGNNKSKKVDQESRSFTEILEQLAVITLPSTMGAGLKAVQNDEIPAQEQGDCLAKPLAKAMKSFAAGNDLKIPGAKVNGTAGSGAKAEKLSLLNGEEKIPIPEDNRKSQATIDKAKLNGTQNAVSKIAKDNPASTVGKVFSDPQSEISAGKAKTDVNIASSQAVSKEKQNIPGSRTGQNQAQADINLSAASRKKLTASIAEAGASNPEKPNSPGSSQDTGTGKQNIPGSSQESKVLQEFEPVQAKEPIKKTDTHNYPGVIEKSGSSIDLPAVKNPESIEKAVLSKSQLDSIVSNMIQQIKAGPSSLELSLKPEYLGKINIMVELNESMISIKVVAQSGEAANLLNSNLLNIKENLEQQGVKIQQMEVDLANQEKQDNQKGGREQNKQSSHSHKHIPANYGIADNREQIYLLPNKLNVWA